MSDQAQLPPQTPKRSSLGRKLRRVVFALAAGVVLALVGGELWIRWILFHSGEDRGPLAASLRSAGRYADGNYDDDYWKLNSILLGGTALDDAPGPDPILGWTGGGITPGTYEHPFESTVGDRQLVLLYGDSFAQCNTPPSLCFQSILESSDLGRRFAMLNYGVGGFGLDQIYLMLEHSIDRFKAKNPIVIVGILVDSDLERSILGFRGWGKPRLDVVGDRLVARGPVPLTTRGYLAENPISIKSYLWNLFLYQNSRFMEETRARWRGVHRITEEKKLVNRRILEEIERVLSSRGLRHFFLVFHAEQGALSRWEPFEWQEQMIEDVCAEHSIPLIDTRAWLSFASDGYKEKCARLYGHSSPLLGHHNAAGNIVCFEAMRQGLLGQFGAPDTRHLAALIDDGLLEFDTSETKPCTFLGRPATLITHASYGAPRSAETSNPNRLQLRADLSGYTAAKFELEGGAKRLSGQLHTMADAQNGCPEQGLRFSIEVDGAVVLDCPVVPPAANPMSLDIDLTGARTLTLIARGDRGGAGCNWLCVENPRLD